MAFVDCARGIPPLSNPSPTRGEGLEAASQYLGAVRGCVVGTNNWADVFCSSPCLRGRLGGGGRGLLELANLLRTEFFSLHWFCSNYSIILPPRPGRPATSGAGGVRPANSSTVANLKPRAHPPRAGRSKAALRQAQSLSRTRYGSERLSIDSPQACKRHCSRFNQFRRFPCSFAHYFLFLSQKTLVSLDDRTGKQPFQWSIIPARPQGLSAPVPPEKFDKRACVVP